MAKANWRQARQAIALAFGIMLIVAAVIYAGRGMDWQTLLHASPWQLGMLLLAVGANVVLTGLLFWVVTLSFDARPRVNAGRMIMLICASGLLNYLPLLRPGLIGRATYLKVRHQLPLRQSMVILLAVLALSIVVLGILAGALLATLTLPQWWGWGGALLALAALTVCTQPVAAAMLRRQVTYPWLWVPLRLADVLVAAARLWLAFQIVGQPLGFREVVVAAAASLLVKLVGLTPNGIGLSEWVVAALASAMAPVQTAAGAAAALVDRSAEVVVLVVSGLISVWKLRH